MNYSTQSAFSWRYPIKHFVDTFPHCIFLWMSFIRQIRNDIAVSFAVSTLDKRIGLTYLVLNWRKTPGIRQNCPLKSVWWGGSKQTDTKKIVVKQWVETYHNKVCWIFCKLIAIKVYLYIATMLELNNTILTIHFH